METERHFGRLLTSPFCTRKHPYVINVLKSLISICSAGKETYFISHIKFLRLEVSRYGYRDPSVCFKEISALIHILLRRFQDDLYFYESFMLLAVLVLPAGSDEKEWGTILSDGLKRIWAGPQAISALSALDEIYSDFGKDLFKALAPLVTLDLVSPIMLESFTKAVTSRFDDDFNGAWQLVSSIDRNIIPRLNPQRNLDIFLSFTKVQCVLGKISTSEAALDLAVNLLERLFGCRLEFRDDDDGALMIGLAELIHLNLARQDSSCQNWIISSLTSNIRRLIPSTPIDVGASGIDCQFINMTRFTSLLLSKFPSDPLYQISVQFIGSFASPKGLSKNSVLCSAYISTILQPGFLLRCEQLAQDILLDILEHCEGTSQVLDESYLGCLHVALQQIREKLRIETSRPLLSLVFIVSSNGLSSKRFFASPIRYQILSFLLDELQEHSTNTAVAQLLDGQLYPLINSLLHCRLQDQTSSLPFEFQCFVQEQELLILDLVALSSWVQIKSGLKSFQHFLAVYSPTATWIAYGKKIEHRQLCFEMYFRWEKLSQGLFSAHHKDVFAVSMLHCLFISKINKSVVQRISEMLRCPADILIITHQVLESSDISLLKGALQFLPQIIDEADSTDWGTFSSRLCQQLILFERKTNLICGKVTIPEAFEAMLRKEEKLRHNCGPFVSSNLIFLASALLRVTDGRTFDNIMLILIHEFSHAEEPVYATCLDLLLSSVKAIELAVQVIGLNLEYFDTSRRFLRFTAECMTRCSEDVLNSLFSFSGTLPSTLKQHFAWFIWIIINAHIPLTVEMEHVLEWIISEESDISLIAQFKTKYRGLNRLKHRLVDFGMSFVDTRNPLAVLRSCIEDFVQNSSAPKTFLQNLRAL